MNALRGVTLGAATLLGAAVLLSCSDPASERGPVGAAGTTRAAASPIAFEDVTEAAGVRFTHSYGGGAFDNIVKAVGGGIAVLDADGDGRMDLYLVGGGWDADAAGTAPRPEKPARSMLWRNRGDGTFEDVTDRAGVANEGSMGFGAAAADYDGDGDTDLYACNYRENRLYRNRGDGTFEDATAAAGVAGSAFSVHAVWTDYDVDGDLDLYVVNYLTFDPTYRVFYAPEGFPGPLAYAGAADVLYRNEGDGTFRDVTKEAGVLRKDGRGMSALAADLDRDGWPDIFVANDAMENWFWRGKGDGTFENVAVENGTAYGLNGESTAAMGADAADWNGDGLLDFFVPDMAFSCLYTADRKGAEVLFRERSASTGIARASGQNTGWGGAFLDVDLDGRPDLFRANGNDHHLFGEQPLLLRNLGDGGFEDVSRTAGPAFLRKVVGRAAATADLANDGRLWIVMQTAGGPTTLLRNRTPTTNHWLTVRAVGDPKAAPGPRRSTVSAVGARILVTAGDWTQVQEVRAGGPYLSSSDPRPTFGLGPVSTGVRVVVEWPSGNRTELGDVPVDRVLEVRETATGRGEVR